MASQTPDGCIYVVIRMVIILSVIIWITTKMGKNKEKSSDKELSSSINIGISEEDRIAIADGLSRLLADTYTLYLKTHNFHWNL